MKYLFSLLILFSVVGHTDAQIDVRQKDSCYFRYGYVKSGDSVKRIRLETKDQLRYVEWECGKRLGVIDCNGELTFDEETNTVYKVATDMSNFSGNNKPFSGTCESCHRNGRVQRRVTFVNGKENGADTTYYESGCPQVIRQLVNGIEHGTWYYHFDSTEFLAWEENYYMGFKNGPQKYFGKPFRTKTGRFQSDTLKIENYQNGILHGAKKSYYLRGPDGKGGSLKREVNYKNGYMDGPFKIYNLDRVVIEELNYVQGKKDQECRYYYDDGTLLRTENWKAGKRNGECKTLYYQQTLQKVENYKEGVKEGWFEEYYPDGKLKHRVLFSRDVLIEEYKYDEHGREIYSFPEYTAGGAEDDALPTEQKQKNKESYLKAHRKKMIKESKKRAKEKKKKEMAAEKEKRKKEKEEIKKQDAEAKEREKELKRRKKEFSGTI